MIIINPKLKDAEKYEEEVFILSAVKGSPCFEGKKSKSIWDLKFFEVEKVKECFQNMTDENLIYLFELFYSKKDIKNSRCLEFYRAFNYIKEELLDVIEKEKLLSSEPDEKLINAGIKELSIFGSLNILKEIGMQFGKSPEEVEKWNYGLVFSLALSNKKEVEIHKRLNK